MEVGIWRPRSQTRACRLAATRCVVGCAESGSSQYGSENPFTRPTEGMAFPSRWLYLAVVLDLFSRKVVGWAMPASANAIWQRKNLSLCLEVLDHYKSRRAS